MNKKLSLIITLLIIACEPENNNEIQASSVESVSTLEVQRILQPYSMQLKEERLFKNIPTGAHIDAPFIKDIDIEELSYENISNTNAKMAIVPTTIKYAQYYSRVLLLKIDGEIKTVVLNVKQDPFSNEMNFSGDMVVSDLEGNYIHGYKVENGKIVVLYLPERSQPNLEASILTGLVDLINASEYFIQDDDESDFFINLNEVELWGELSYSNNINISWLFNTEWNEDEPFGDSGGRDDMYWDSDPGDEGGSKPEQDEESCKSGEIRDENGKCIDEELFNFLNSDVWNQNNPYDDWNRLTECEKDFFKNSPHHLYTAVGNKKAAEKASWNRFSECNTPNGNPMHNTIGDAYRHAYFAALNTHNMGYKNAQVLGDAHECDVPPHKSNEKQMDLHNNNWGYHYGSTVSYVNEKQFYDSFMDAFNKGQIKILEECQ